MLPQTAADLLNHIEFKRNGAEWRVRAKPFDRFEDSILLEIDYPVIDSSRNHWDVPEGGEQDDGATKEKFYVTTKWVIQAGCCSDDTDLYREFLAKVAIIDSHEAREALRIRPSLWAPFHPHRTGGMERWGDPQGDIMFGLA